VSGLTHTRRRRDAATITVGLISDTHGLLRSEALTALRGSDYLVHAGDIGAPEILAALAELAPLTVVRGNNDRAAWASGLRETAVLAVGKVLIHVVHDLAGLDRNPDGNPAVAGCAVVVSGHSHRPGWRKRDVVLYINPGSAGPRRFSLPITVGRLLIAGSEVTPELIELDISRR
jgi:putative phosphoesterase